LLPHIIISAVEHDSVLKATQHFESLGQAEVTILPVDRFGHVCSDMLYRNLKMNTVLVSIIMAQNETGVLQPVRKLVQSVRTFTERHPQSTIYVHTDASQAIGKISVDVISLDVNYATLTSHKVSRSTVTSMP
jgi:cysteine sulfinate desulfinase/cysteine desulfurase-like protein